MNIMQTIIKYFKKGKECISDEADEVIVQKIDNQGNLAEETRYFKVKQ
jgi:hypothetical protein